MHRYCIIGSLYLYKLYYNRLIYQNLDPGEPHFYLQIKSFHAELLIPVENKQEGEFKQISVSIQNAQLSLRHNSMAKTHHYA